MFTTYPSGFIVCHYKWRSLTLPNKEKKNDEMSTTKLLDGMRFQIQLRTHRMPSWCLRRVRPSRSGSPQRGLWYIACWDPKSACVAVHCFRVSPAVGLWNEATSSPKWSRNSQGRIPAFGRTTSTSTRSPWWGSSFECVVCVQFRMSWASWCSGGRGL